MRFSYFIYPLILLFCVSCANLPIQRHPGSGYSGFTGQTQGEVSLEELAERDKLQQKQRSPKDTRAQKLSVPQEQVRLQRTIASLVEQNDIALGMDMSAVRESWGIPDKVYVTGEERHQNQIWKYSIPVQMTHDFHIEERLVKFENGKVAGWQSK